VLMVARHTIIPLLILPTLMAPKAAKLTPMTVREQLMEPTAAQQPGVMVAAPLMAPMAAQLHGVMDLELQHQLAEKLQVGAGKQFMV
jgi:hypothetical protein